MKIYGACGVEDCTDCFPLFDENNEEVTDRDGYLQVPFEKIRILKDTDREDYPWQVDAIIKTPDGKVAAYSEAVSNYATWQEAFESGFSDIVAYLPPHLL